MPHRASTQNLLPPCEAYEQTLTQEITFQFYFSCKWQRGVSISVTD